MVSCTPIYESTRCLLIDSLVWRIHVGRFLPTCCDIAVTVKIDTDDAGNEFAVSKENKKSWKNLSLAAWMAAWDRYALAMAMIDMLGFNVAMRYKQVGCVLSVSRCVHVMFSFR